MKKVTLKELIKFNNGLNLMSNLGINLGIDLSYELTLFKKKSTMYTESYMEVMKEIKGTDSEKESKALELLGKEYEIKIPKISLTALKESKVEVPLSVFDFIGDYIIK